MGKRYQCHRWPSLGVGNSINFANEFYTAKNEEEEAFIEALPYFGIHVWLAGQQPNDVVEYVEPETTIDSETTTQRRGRYRPR